MPRACVLDSNTVSFLVAKDEFVTDNLRQAIRENCAFYLCPIPGSDAGSEVG